MSSNIKRCSFQVGLKDSGYEEGGRERETRRLETEELYR